MLILIIINSKDIAFNSITKGFKGDSNYNNNRRLFFNKPYILS